MARNYIILAILLLVSISFADNYTSDGHGGAFWDNGNGARISVYPDVSYSYGNNMHIQQVNFSYNNSNPILVNISFVFEQPIEAGSDLYLWQNTTKYDWALSKIRSSELRTITPVGFTQLFTPPAVCNIGDQQNTQWYSANMGNGTITACFDSAVPSGSSYILNYSFNKSTSIWQAYTAEDWVSIGTSFFNTRFGNYDVWTINNVNFTNPTLHKTRIMYRAGGTGKYSIYVHDGSPTEVVFNTKPVHVMLDPTWVSGANENLPYWVENNTASNYQIYARGNLTALGQYNITIYYGGTTNRSNIKSTFDFGDDFSTDTTANYVQSSAGCTLSFNATSKSLSQSNAGVCLIEPITARSLGTAYNQILTVNFLPSGFGNYEGGATGFSTNSAVHGYATAAAIGRGGYDINKLGDTYYQLILSTITVGVPQHTYGSWNTLGNGSAMVNGSFYAQNGSLIRNTFIDSRDTSGYYGIYMNSQTAQYDDYAAYAQCGQQTIAYGAEITSPVVQDGETYQKHRSVYINSTVGGNCTFLLDRNQFNSSEMFIVSGVVDAAGSTITSLNFTTGTPTSGSILNRNYIYATAIKSSNIGTCLLYINGTSYAASVNSTHCYLNKTGMADGNYGYYLYGYNSTNQSQNTTTAVYTITLDTTTPIITAYAPLTGSFAYLNQSFSFNFTETNPAYCILQINGTNYTMNNQTGGCYAQINNTVGNVSYFYFIKDLANNSVTSTNLSIMFYNVTNYSIFYSNPENDMMMDNISILILTNGGVGLSASAILQYNGINYTASTYSNASNSFVSFYNVLPPAVSTPTVVNGTWFFTLNSSSFQLPFSTTVQPGGLTYCGNLTNTTSIHYNVLDSLTFTLISANLSVSIAQSTASSSKSSVLNIGGSNISICINPPSLYVNASLNESFTATGYVGKLVSRSVSQYFANSANLTVYLVNSSSPAYFQTIINVINNNRAPMPNVFVIISQQNVTSNTYYQIISAQTNENGATTQLLVPNSVFYQMTVLDSSGNLLQSYSPAVISCNTLTQTVCNVVLVVGEITTAPYISTFNYANASCSWNNVTGNLACTPIGLEINSTELSVILINQTAYNATICTQTGIGLATVTCTLPTAAGNCYNFAFRGTLNIGETPVLGGGRICISGPTAFTQNSGIGLLLAFVLLAIGAVIGLAFGAAGVLIGMAFGLILAVAFSFVTGIAWYGAIGAIAALLVAAWVVK